MNKMNNFLKECFKFKNLTNICYVLGNESCDLDSAVSAITLAYFYEHNKDKTTNRKIYDGFVPILNVAREHFPIKTEVNYYFKENEIDIENVCFMDDIKEESLKSNDIIIVDHNETPYYENVVKCFDHHLFDVNNKLKNNCDLVVCMVGSCSTLIADFILKYYDEKYNEILKLLYGPIVLDTVNFSKEADKAKLLDFEVSNEIEKKLSLTVEYKNDLFDKLVKARAAVDGLNAYQILFKDMKLVLNNAETVSVCIPGYPILVQDFIKMENAEKSVTDFAKLQDCNLIVLMGMKIIDGNVQRDLGIINIDNDDLYEKVIEAIEKNTECNLEVEKYEDCKFLNGIFYNQKNIKASRKQILPLVKKVMDTFK